MVIIFVISVAVFAVVSEALALMVGASGTNAWQIRQGRRFAQFRRAG